MEQKKHFQSQAAGVSKLIMENVFADHFSFAALTCFTQPNDGMMEYRCAYLLL